MIRILNYVTGEVAETKDEFSLEAQIKAIKEVIKRNIDSHFKYFSNDKFDLKIEAYNPEVQLELEMYIDKSYARRQKFEEKKRA